MRRLPLLVLVAALASAGVLLAAPGLASIVPRSVLVGAVLPAVATGAPNDGSATTPTPDPTSTPQPTSTLEPTPTPTPTPRPTAPAVAPALVGEGPMAPDPRTLAGYRWPLPRGRISSEFGPSWYGALLVDGQRFHDGLDIATFCGDRVVAAHDGVVVAAGRRFDEWIGWIGDLGPHARHMAEKHLWGTLPIVVVIDDGNGYRSVYAHFNAIAVRVGQRVKAGRLLGWEGSTGFATGCHLHYGLFSPWETERFRLRPDVRQRTKYPTWEIARIDPLLVLPKRPSSSAKPTPSPSSSPNP